MKLFLKSSIISLVLLLGCILLEAQPWKSPYNFTPPIAGTLNISGAFGELRTDHFHSGVDFRTGGKIGAKVFAAEKGYVSRVRISVLGFGKAIYIDHPNGLTTAYAHMDKFTEKIENLIKEHQYREQSFEVDIYLKPEDLMVTRGQLIGWSGNSGSSGGPHLHWEVRRTTNQNPLNPQFSNIPITDSMSPLIKSSWIYPIDFSSTITSINKKKELHVQGDGSSFSSQDTVLAFGNIGIGVETYDYVNTGSSRCGVYEIMMYVNGSIHYQFMMDEFSFAESRFANSHLDYELRQQTTQRVHRLFLDPNNRLSAYTNVKNNGVIEIKSDSVYNILVVVGDSYGNKSNYALTIKGEMPTKNFETPICPFENGLQSQWLYYLDNQVMDKYFTVIVPKNALYQNLLFNYGVSEMLPGSYSPVIHIHDRLTPVHTSYTLKVNAVNLPEQFRSKALLGTFDPKGKVEALEGDYVKGYVTATLRSFGDFFIIIDTLAPTLIPLNITNGKELKNQADIRFRVKDDLSGITSLKCYIDGEWVLFEHDPKNDLAFYTLDSKRITRNKDHKLLVLVEDKKKNVNRFECSFHW